MKNFKTIRSIQMNRKLLLAFLLSASTLFSCSKKESATSQSDGVYIFFKGKEVIYVNTELYQLLKIGS